MKDKSAAICRVDTEDAWHSYSKEHLGASRWSCKSKRNRQSPFSISLNEKKIKFAQPQQSADDNTLEQKVSSIKNSEMRLKRFCWKIFISCSRGIKKNPPSQIREMKVSASTERSPSSIGSPRVRVAGLFWHPRYRAPLVCEAAGSWESRKNDVSRRRVGQEIHCNLQLFTAFCSFL